MTPAAVDRLSTADDLWSSPHLVLAGQNVGLPRLVNNLLGGVPLLCHESGLRSFNILGNINLDQKLQGSS